MTLSRMQVTSLAIVTAILALALAMAAITVVAPGAASQAATEPTRGRIPDRAVTKDGAIDFDLVPDFVAVWSRDGSHIAGYVRKGDLDPFEGQVTEVPAGYVEPPMVVYGEDLTTVVGHMYPDKGFVPVDSDPEDIPDFTIELSGAS